MGRVFMLLIILLCHQVLFSQNKVRLKYEYDVTKDERTRKVKKELYKIYKYDRTGFLKEIVTYGKTKQTMDTINVKQEDGTDERRIVAKYMINTKKAGRIEHFKEVDDSTLFSKGFEIWYPHDTFRFENSYLKYGPDVYQVQSTSAVPYGRNSDPYCDHDFESKYSERKSRRQYDTAGRVASIRYFDHDSMLQNARTVYYRYDAGGRLAIDSTVKDGAFVVKNKYIYNKSRKLQTIEKTMVRSASTIQYLYNRNGDVIKKFVKEGWTIEYKYVYY